MADKNKKTEEAAPQDAVVDQNVNALNTLLNLACSAPNQQIVTAQNAANVLGRALGLQAKPRPQEEKGEGKSDG